MKLVDEAGHEVLQGKTGELVIKGPHVCDGYWRNRKATSEALKDGWFFTGDMALKDEDGFYTIAGRYKDMIISGGENIYAAEVEAVFMEHQAVAEAALIGKPDQKWGEIGMMIVVLEKGDSSSAEDLKEYCSKHLAKYKVPKQVVFVESLPHSPYGKVIKSDLRDRHLN
jgi:fatty-acyl-CoA synthase